MTDNPPFAQDARALITRTPLFASTSATALNTLATAATTNATPICSVRGNNRNTCISWPRAVSSSAPERPTGAMRWWNCCVPAKPLYSPPSSPRSRT